LILSSGPLTETHIRRSSRGFFGRISPVWNSNQILKHVHPIRSRARKIARSPFMGNSVVAASLRIQQGGLPPGYRLSDTAREFAVFQDCEQLATILASRVGDAKVAPNPPLWPLLAMILFEWREVLSAKDILVRGAAMGLQEEVRRGLIIVSYLFPELQEWLAELPLGIPLWERALAVPLTARKLVLLEKTS